MVPATHRFRRMCPTQSIVGTGVYAPYLNGQAITLGDIAAPSEFTNLFDSYRIDYVVFKFYMTVTPDAQTGSTASYPRMWWHIDYDDAASPSNLDELKQDRRTRCAILDPKRPIVVKWKPSVLQLVFNTPVQSTFAPKWKQFIDCAFNATPHYGIKYAIDNFTNPNYKMDIERTVYFTMKDSR